MSGQVLLGHFCHAHFLERNRAPPAPVRVFTSEKNEPLSRAGAGRFPIQHALKWPFSAVLPWSPVTPLWSSLTEFFACSSPTAFD